MTKPTPIDHIRIGAINAAIWANQTDSGTRYGITFERLYRDSESGVWKSSHSFNRDDLLIIAKVADQAHSRVYELQTIERNQSRDDSGNAAIAETQPKPPVPRTGGASAPIRTKARAGVSR